MSFGWKRVWGRCPTCNEGIFYNIRSVHKNCTSIIRGKQQTQKGKSWCSNCKRYVKQRDDKP